MGRLRPYISSIALVSLGLRVLLRERAFWRYQLVDLTPAFAADQIIRTVADPLLVLDQEGGVQVAQ